MKNGERCKKCGWKIYIRNGKQFMRVYIGGDVFQDRPHLCNLVKNLSNKRLHTKPSCKIVKQ